MDPLSDLLRVVHLDAAHFYAVDASQPWSAEAVAARELMPRVIPTSEHLISYHILTEGRCFGGLLGEEMVELAAGDAIVFPHGDPHLMSSEPGRSSNTVFQTEAVSPYPFNLTLGTGPRSTALLCGFLGCDLRPFNPLLSALPHRMHARGVSNPWLGDFIRQVTDESASGRSGAVSVLTRLAELMFIEVIRRYLDAIPEGQTGWLAGLRDEVVGRVLTLIHERPAHAWTLETLAHEAATSRSSLARRFTELVGTPPMQYLASWRMQVAANLLTKSGSKVATIGEAVGYDSEAAFSRAFKKATGLAPGAWREARRSNPV